MLLSDFLQRGRSALDPLYPEAEARGLLDILCESFLGVRSYTAIIEPGYGIPPSVLPALQGALERLSDGEPVQYILGKASFCGREFRVGPSVLIPRPETEQLCSEAEHALSGLGAPRVLDLCTGSGNIAWTLALDLPGAQVTGVDLSETALETARGQSFPVEPPAVAPVFLQADLLQDPPAELRGKRFDAVLSNPPYVCESEKALMRRNVLNFEPASALFVPDDDPMLFYRAVACWAKELLKPGGLVMAEINESLGLSVKAVFADMGFENVLIVKDLFGKDRFVRCWNSQ